MTNKLYAVKEGRVPGIYSTWSDCQQQVKGFSNARYKSFATEPEATAYLDEENSSSIRKIPKNPIDAQLYVDGSWNNVNQQYGWGVVIVVCGRTVSSGYGAGRNPSYISQRQIGGEVVAVLQGLSRAVFKEYKHVEAVYDYQGIESWVIGDWSTKSSIGGAYVYHLETYKDQLDITFIKVKSHSGNKYNDMPDRLAKKGAHKCSQCEVGDSLANQVDGKPIA
ncbi:ribonuclease H family protein [uncultured Vagococcus sp.]|uniref:ribonuclease H family protein n=1 Tax=uncultured Vagococcus sp. TaxID=189676 RepID=UPI0028D1920A|nr:ribonuclease H family protein [uncultured Vagococcus sp.]